VARARWMVGVLAAGVLLGACVDAPSEPSDPPSESGAPGGRVGAEQADPAATSVRVDGRTLVVADEDTGARELATLTDEDGEVVHTAVRPGDHDALTVLVLTRVEDEVTGPRYELRYVVETDDGATALYWFPWYLQVEEQLTAVLDVPPLPVWAPDGSALAWVEWADDGTQLRAVGWVDDGVSRNPSAEAAAYRLDDVPAGVQLDGWEPGAGSTAVLTGSLEDQRYRIAVDPGEGTIAMPTTERTTVAGG
jgi:hypothetical protein